MDELLFEYYERISKPQDNDILGQWEVWVYGSDREAFPPHCHVRLPKEHLEFEVSLMNWEVINIKNSEKPDSWDSIGKEIKYGFFEWLTRASKTDGSITNRKYLYYMWDSLNSNNRLEKWANREKKENLDKDLLDVLGWNVDYQRLSKEVIGTLTEIYFTDKEKRSELHKLAPQELLSAIGVEIPIVNDEQALEVVQTAEKNVYMWSLPR